MSEKKVVDWFIMNGKHIPIYEGESKSDAVNRSIAKDNEDKKTTDIERNKQEADRLNTDKPKKKLSEKQQFKEIAKAIQNKTMPIERAYYDIPTEFAEKLFNKYDASDLYEYLTSRERNSAYKDMQGIGAHSKQIQLEWMKKAIWRIAKANAWDDLEVW